jgi:YD repeat-containing protein
MTIPNRDGANETPVKPYYFLNLPAQVRTHDNGSATTYWRCSRASYDGLGYVTGANSSLKAALPTQSDAFQACDSGGAGTNPLTATQGYDAFGQSLVSLDADANAGDASHTACAVTGSDTLWLVAPSGATSFTNCTRYDGTYHAFTTGTANAMNQATATTYDYVQGVATSSTDVNGQITNMPAPVYEYNGAVSLANFQDVYSDTALPGETYGSPTPWTTRVFVFSFCANATTGGKPCLEADTVKQLDGTNLLVTRTFQDRDGRTVETRVSGPIVGQDTVTITGYNDQAHTKFDSQTCLVPALTTSNGGRTVSGTAGYIAPTQTASGSSAYVDPAVAGTNCSSGTLKGTTTYYDALDRVIATDDAIGAGAGTSGSGCLLPGGNVHHTTCMAISPVVASSTAGLPGTDTQPYLRTLTIDANLHQSASYADGRNKTAYVQRFTGASQNPVGSGVASYAVVSYTYDANENLRGATDAAGNILTYSYNNTANRLDSMVDPDRGTETYSYDANGNKLTTTDARGQVTCSIYDGLNRQIQRGTNTACTSGIYVTYAYDDTTGGNMGVGRLTSETFSSGLGNGARSYVYDGRGQTTTNQLVIGGNTYTIGTTYDDAGNTLTQQYPTTETVTTSYNAAGAVIGMTTSAGPTTLLSNVTYSATNGRLTGATFNGGTYTFSESYDGLLRPSDLRTARTSGNVTMFDEGLTYDNVGNVATANTTLYTGTDNQKFCYDEQDRLTWAGATGASPCNGAVTAGSLTAAQYTNSFGYDTLGRLTSGPGGAYTYGDSAHKHAATAVGTNWTAQYDASGDMTCRAPTSSATCSGTITGAALTYDNEGWLTAWQDEPSSPTSTDSFLYDGEGNCVALKATERSPTTSASTARSLAAPTPSTSSQATVCPTVMSAGSGKAIFIACFKPPERAADRLAPGAVWRGGARFPSHQD